MGSFPSLSSSIFGMEHSGENYGYVMFGIAVATLSAPAITNTVLGNGYDINAVFAIGAFSAAIELVQLITRVGSCYVDDIILNTLGGAVGYVLYRLIKMCKKRWLK